MKIYIQCESCMENITINDGYNNSEEITLRITGKQIIEIECNSCNEKMTIIDGQL